MRSEYYDALETRDADLREDELFRQLPNLIALALAAPGWASHLAGIEPNDITSRAALAQLPVLRDAELAALRQQFPPFGGLNVRSSGRMHRLLVLPGPAFVLEGSGKDSWGAARALFAAGFREGDVVHNAFTREPTAAGVMMESGAAALGCTMIDVTSDDAYLHLAAIEQLKPRGYVGAPAVLHALLDAAARAGQDISSFDHALVCGEPLSQAVQAGLATGGIAVSECLVADDLGVIAYESPTCDGLLVNENLIVEIVRPGGTEPLPPGEIGEVIVTSLNPDLPMIRRGTGTLSAILKGKSPCGRSNMRLKGVLGSA